MERGESCELNVLLLAAAKLPRQLEAADYPVCLTEIDGKPLLERISESLKVLEGAHLAYVFLQSEARRYHLEQVAKLLVPSVRCFSVPEQTQGSACTALFAACQLKQTAELLLLSGNELVDMDLGQIVRTFRELRLDAGTLVFRSVHPRYSYVRLDESGLVVQTAQREPISSTATAGLFWFARTGDFVEAAKNLVRKNAHVEDAYFVAPTFNELILKHMRVGVLPLDLARYIPLKTERQIHQRESL